MNCEIAKLYYYDYLQKNHVSEDVTEHIAKCPDCQAAIENLKDELSRSETVEKPWRPDYLQQHYRLLDQWVSCDMVEPFLPSLLTPQLSVTRPTPVTVHIDHCPACKRSLNVLAALGLTSSELIRAAQYLAGQTVELDVTMRDALSKIQQINRSDVITRMRQPDSERLSDSAVIDVEHRSAISAIPRRQAVTRRAVPLWITGGIAAAIVFAILLVLPAGDVQAVDVEQLYTTLENVQNAYIQKYAGSQELEKILISDGLGIYLFQRDEELVFVNMESGNMYQQHQGTVQQVPRKSPMALERPWGLLPFKHISQLPASYDWTYISDAVLEGELNVRIYEWTWTETPNSQLRIKHIWRGYLDPNSYLPYRIESLDEINDSPAELIMEMRVSYPSNDECREIFESYGFKGLVYGDQNEVFKTVPVASN